MKRPRREHIRAAILDGRIDVVAADAPHTKDEKMAAISTRPRGALVQHALVAMLDLVHDGLLPVEKVVDLMAHRVARLFRMNDRGFIRPGKPIGVGAPTIHGPCAKQRHVQVWMVPFTGHVFKSRVHERGNGTCVGTAPITTSTVTMPQRLTFNR